jgi:alpha-ketoglutarate-dependent taurine dioxygenase
MTTALNSCDENSPFLLENEGAYQAWRARKLRYREELTATTVYSLNPESGLPDSMRDQIEKQVVAFNFVVFESTDQLGKSEFLALNRQFGLQDLDVNLGADEDKVTSLQVVSESDERSQYIPYTSRGMNWHTDGYYNPDGRRINAFALYCVHQSERGGGNFLFDHEMMYLLIRDEAPNLLEALMCDDLMCIPANVQGNRVIRAEETGPVFSLQPETCALNMRYTSRPHNIVWKSDRLSAAALNRVREILMDGKTMVEIKLRERQGIVCNNILHGRQAFQNGADMPPRLVYRARYYDAIDFDKALAWRPRTAEK